MKRWLLAVLLVALVSLIACGGTEKVGVSEGVKEAATCNIDLGAANELTKVLQSDLSECREDFTKDTALYQSALKGIIGTCKPEFYQCFNNCSTTTIPDLYGMTERFGCTQDCLLARDDCEKDVIRDVATKSIPDDLS